MNQPMETTTVNESPAPARRTPLRLAVACSLLVGLAACESASDVELLQIRDAGALVGQVFLDLNGNGAADAADSALADVGVVLYTASARTPVDTTETDDEGFFAFGDVPVGAYELSVSKTVLGDSLASVAPEEALEVTPGDTLAAVLGVSFPELTVEEVRAAEIGRRVFTTGIALNSRENFTDGRVFLEGESAFLQASDVARSPGISVGDSVRLLGRTVTRAGQPMLDGVTAVILVPRAEVPIPELVSTSTAAEADGGALDAALVEIRDAVITDTASVGDTLMVTADDGSGPVRLAVRPFLGRSTTDLVPDAARITRAIGMLSPYEDGSGTVRWRLLVRTGGELGTAPVSPSPVGARTGSRR